MFPTISSLIAYFFDVYINLPIPTFGFFVLLAFILAYLTFLSEFKRKEAEGVIQPFEEIRVEGRVATVTTYLEFAFLGFLLGFKVIGAFYHQELFLRAPLKFIFSWQGTWLYAILLSVFFILLVYLQKKEDGGSKKVITTVSVHPYELMPKLILWAALWGFLGAKVFNYMENIQLYSSHSLMYFLKHSGLTFYGGLIFGGSSIFYNGYKRGLTLKDIADIGAPGMLVAYGIGRIGCQLSGDGDWGIVNNYAKPFAWIPDWMWSFKFPYNVLNQGEYITGCMGKYCAILPQGVFPTSFYESVIILGSFLILWFNRKKIRSRGLMFYIYLLIISIERFLIEFIRVNFKYNILGWHLSAAQVISLLFIMLTITIGTYILIRERKKFDQLKEVY